MNKYIKLLSLFLFFMLPITAISSEINCSKWSKLDESGACVIPLIKAIVSPSDVVDKYVRLSGVISFEYERNILYMDSFSYNEHIFENGIDLAVAINDFAPYRHFNGDIVKIYGYLKKLKTGEYSFTEIEKIISSKNGIILFSEVNDKKEVIYIPNE